MYAGWLQVTRRERKKSKKRKKEEKNKETPAELDSYNMMGTLRPWRGWEIVGLLSDEFVFY